MRSAWCLINSLRYFGKYPYWESNSNLLIVYLFHARPFPHRYFRWAAFWLFLPIISPSSRMRLLLSLEIDRLEFCYHLHISDLFSRFFSQKGGVFCLSDSPISLIWPRPDEHLVILDQSLIRRIYCSLQAMYPLNHACYVNITKDRNLRVHYENWGKCEVSTEKNLSHFLYLDLFLPIRLRVICVWLFGGQLAKCISFHRRMVVLISCQHTHPPIAATHLSFF